MPGSQFMKPFLQSSKFAVVGASSNSEKFGFKVLRWYMDRSKNVIPINPTLSAIEGISTVSTVRDLSDPKNTAISVITPPGVTIQVLKDAQAAKIPYIWLQPGAEDNAVLQYARDNDLKLIYGGPCILASGDSVISANRL